MIKAKELQARLEAMIDSYGENCSVGTFSDILCVYDENEDYVQEIEM